MRTLQPARSAVMLPAADIQPGYITIDGVVLDVERGEKALDHIVYIRHRSTTYIENADDLVQVFARIDRDGLALLIEAVEEDRKR